jgi:hypothetical protein
MANIVVTNVVTGEVVLRNGEWSDNVVTLGAGITLLKGTLLARETATQKLLPYVKGGDPTVDGTPTAVITYEFTSVAAGDYTIRPAIKGTLSFEKLVIAVDGDNSNIDQVVRDELRTYALPVVDVRDLTELDNQ